MHLGVEDNCEIFAVFGWLSSTRRASCAWRAGSELETLVVDITIQSKGGQ